MEGLQVDFSWTGVGQGFTCVWVYKVQAVHMHVCKSKRAVSGQSWAVIVCVCVGLCVGELWRCTVLLTWVTADELATTHCLKPHTHTYRKYTNTLFTPRTM